MLINLVVAIFAGDLPHNPKYRPNSKYGSKDALVEIFESCRKWDKVKRDKGFMQVDSEK